MSARVGDVLPQDPTAAEPAADAVLRDLVDAAIQEQLVVVGAPGADGWGRVGGLRARLRPGGALQPWRLAAGPLLDDDGTVVDPGAALRALDLEGPGATALSNDLVDAVRHAGVGERALRRLGTRPGSSAMLLGERLAATRGRPFHPTGRAVSGWDAHALETWGPMRPDPMALAWVAVHRDRLRLGPSSGSGRLHELVLPPGERDHLVRRMVEVGLDAAAYQPLPVHPWQARAVLPGAFDDELRAGLVVPLEHASGRFHPTVALRTLVRAEDDTCHLKLPLGVATLGATRLLPPRYLDNGDRAERTLRVAVEGDEVLGGLVEVCDEGCWAGWSDGTDEFDDRPGHLAAQVRTFPSAGADAVTLPMAALAADGWDLLHPLLDRGDPVGFFAGLADAFAAMTVAFLRHGILPEIHGQNVAVRVGPGARVRGFVLRDHDTVRLFPDWAHRAGVPDPGYRVRPGARQTLRLDSATALIGYAQTLGFQINLYGVADALARHHGLDERVLWARLRSAIERALATTDAPRDIVETLRAALLDVPEWPSRTVLGPLLATGRSSSVSMPAGLGTVPNPLRSASTGQP